MADIAFVIVTILMIGVVFGVIRLIRGPNMVDRVISLDLLATLSIGVIVTYSIANDEPVFMDVTAIIALVGFLGTIAFAYYLQRKADD